MIPCGTHCCSSSGWMFSKARIAFFPIVLFFILVTVHQATGTTLKGQKAVFQLNAPDEYGTLSPGTNIHSLGNFTLCIDIRLRQNNLNGMTAFTYNTDTKRIHSTHKHELGIMVKNRKLIIWLFHRQINVGKIISLGNWHSLCLTWNGQTRETHVYVNKTNVLSKKLKSNFRLGQNGSLVLGRKHSRGADRLRVDLETFVGDLYLFRLWDHAKGQRSISQLKCEDGNVITWDSQQWDFMGSILEYDYTLPCYLTTDSLNMTVPSNITSVPSTPSITRADVVSSVTAVPSASFTTSGRFSITSTTSVSSMAGTTSFKPTPSSPSNTTANITIVNVTSSPQNTTANITIINVTSSPQNTRGNSFTNTTTSPVTVNINSVNVTTSLQNTTGNSFSNTTTSPVMANITIVDVTSSPQNTTGNSFTNTTTSPVTANITIVNVTSSPQTRTGNSFTNTTSPVTVNITFINVTSSLQNTTGNSFTNTTTSPVTANITFINVTSSLQNTTGNSFPNTTTSPVTANITFINVTSSLQNTTGNSFTNTTTSPVTANITIINVTSSLQNTTGNSFTNTTTSPVTANITFINVTSSLQNTTGNSFTNTTTSPVTVNITIINVTSSAQNTTGSSFTSNTTSPVTANITIVNVTSSPQNTTENSFINTTTSPVTGNSFINTTNSPVTVNITIVNVTASPQNTTANIIIFNVTSSSHNTTGNFFTNTTTSAVTANITIVNVTSSPQNTTENPPATTSSLPDLFGNATELNETDVASIVSQLVKLLEAESVSVGLGRVLINTISILINVPPAAVASSSKMIIEIVEQIGQKLNFDTDTINITSPSLALAVTKINASGFGGAEFSIGNITNLQVSLDEGSPQASFAAIKLPPSLLNNLKSEDKENASRIQFSFYEKPTLFQDTSIENISVLNSYIIASSVAKLNISDLVDPVQITFRNLQPNQLQNKSDVQCVFWDFIQNNGTGGWNSDGCKMIQRTVNETVCECDHLTHFGILLAISRDFAIDPINNRILTFITYIGCGLSSICLAVTLVTYLVFEKLRRDHPSKILINLCTALLLLNMLFLIDSWISSYDIEGLCIAVAAFLHYFLLVSFTWMSLEALHMYLALVKVFNTYMRRYMLKFCILGWGTPIVVVVIILGTNPTNYGFGQYGKQTNSSSDVFCWINNETTFYVSVVGYFCLMFIVNLSMFIVVMIQLCRIKNKKQHQKAQRSLLRDMKSVASLTLLLGITWGFAFFAWGPVNIPFIYLFAIFNTLQGAFIFIFHCAAKENVQKHWRRYLCFGKLMLAENTDWSRTATNNTKKLQPLVQAMSLSSTSNNSLQSSLSLYPVSDYYCHPKVNGSFDVETDKTNPVFTQDLPNRQRFLK
ncbi:adhesion G-protein coupled receptor G2-like isoform X2 [Heterodontus francisci]|uniref:adhesion G-protein coupled receptor G2-like isoform X2 n=1 Tax=Heterodontus francisci TaxID=7792 RepID=UPI00355C1F77